MPTHQPLYERVRVIEQKAELFDRLAAEVRAATGETDTYEIFLLLLRGAHEMRENRE